MFYNCKPSITRPSSLSCPVSSPVVQGLSVTPSQMISLAERGVPVSVPNSSLSLSEGVQDPVLPIERLRGVDAAEVWEAENDSVERLYRSKKQTDEFYE